MWDVEDVRAKSILLVNILMSANSQSQKQMFVSFVHFIFDVYVTVVIGVFKSENRY